MNPCAGCAGTGAILLGGHDLVIETCWFCDGTGEVDYDPTELADRLDEIKRRILRENRGD